MKTTNKKFESVDATVHAKGARETQARGGVWTYRSGMMNDPSPVIDQSNDNEQNDQDNLDEREPVLGFTCLNDDTTISACKDWTT